MRFLKDLSIRIKVLISPAIFIVALVIVALLGIYGMNQQYVALSAVNEIALTKIRAVDEFITLSEQVQSDVYQISVLHSMNLPKPDIQPINARLQQGLSDLNVAYGEMLTRWQLAPAERAILDRMKPPMDAFRSQAQQAAITVADNPSFGVLLVRSSGVSFAEFRKTLVELQDYQKAKVVRLADETEQSTRTLSSVIIVFAFLITLGALVVTTQMSTRLISQPIHSITQVMRQLASGDLSVKVGDLNRRDEIGAMAKAVEVFRNDAIEKARLDQELRESEEHYRLLFRHSPAGILHYNTRLRITDCNERLAAILQSTLQRLVGFDMNTVSDQSVLPALRQTLAGKDGFYEGLYRATTGFGQVLISMRTAPIFDTQGQVVGGMAVVEDITVRKQAEDELRELNAELQTRNEELDAFAHTVAHDLKNPLGIMVSYAELLLENYGALPDEVVRQALVAVNRSGLKAGSIIESLLMLASVRRQDVQAEPLDMAHIVDEVVLRLADSIQDSGAEISVPDHAGWPVALGHAPWIEEIWVNYLSNALKYGGPQPRIDLDAARQPDGFIRFSVRDDGAGLTPEQQGCLFAPFERLGQARVEGHGLGLSVVRRIAEKLGGQVGVDSQPDRGSTFYFTLPAAPDR